MNNRVASILLPAERHCQGGRKYRGKKSHLR
jgi:hypothetical protein